MAQQPRFFKPSTWTPTSVKNFATDALGIDAIRAGSQKIAKSGINPFDNKKADFGQFGKGLAQTALGAANFIPGAGAAGFGAKLGLKGATAAIKKAGGSSLLKAVSPATTKLQKVTTPAYNKLQQATNNLSTTSLYNKIPVLNKVTNKLLPKPTDSLLKKGLKYTAGGVFSPASIAYTAEDLLFPKTSKQTRGPLAGTNSQSYNRGSQDRITTDVSRPNPLRPNEVSKTVLTGDKYVLLERPNPLRPGQTTKTYVKESSLTSGKLPTGSKIVGFAESVNRVNPLTGKLEKTIVNSKDASNIAPIYRVPAPVTSAAKPTTYKVPSPELQYVPKQQAPITQQTPTTENYVEAVNPSMQNMPEGYGVQTADIKQGDSFGVQNLPYTGPEGGYGVQLADTSSQPLSQTGITYNPSPLAAGESGAIGAASIASQMADAAPASTFIGNTMGEATGMPTTKPEGILGAAQVEGARYLADLASQAQRAAAADAATREQYSQNVMGVRGGAADVLGGRAPAILGQGITGARREYTTGQVANTLSNMSEQEALRRTYGSSLLKAYQKEAQQVLTATQERARAAAQIRGQGVA